MRLGEALCSAEEGDVLEFGCPFPNLSEESMWWEVLEKHKGKDNRLRLTLHGYVFDVLWLAVVALVDPEDPTDESAIEWRHLQ